MKIDKYLAQWNSQLTSGTGKTLTLMGTGILSSILQGVAVLVSADFGNKKTLTDDQLEENSRFVAGAAGAVGGFFGVLETGIKDFVQTPNVFNARAFNQLKALEAASKVVGRGLGLFAGIVTVGFDSYHALEEWNKGNISLMAAYGLSAASGAWLTCIIFASTLSPLGLAITLVALAMMLISAVWIAIEGQDNIQKWLARCLWRNVPGDVGVDIIFLN
ncbi:hypothetical protein [Providencia burhodogranariea]|uniref:Uncharacterized protein n=1 Tax=Providencia burhodogranariea DSM 19968 TaxID=1141662 RepID=K8W5Z3_9GAMM|nr:hypothetical protein [Providencia burhodogranariea]EKT56023.1 hypothetical protein OOA_15462 [Providencia burhodogranariea DSM 19968]